MIRTRFQLTRILRTDLNHPGKVKIFYTFIELRKNLIQKGGSEVWVNSFVNHLKKGRGMQTREFLYKIKL